MDQFRPDSLPDPALVDSAANGHVDDLADASAERHDRVIQLLAHAAELERRTVPHGLVDRVFAASAAQLGAGASAIVDRPATGRPVLRLAGDRTAGERPQRRVAGGGGRLFWGRIGSALAMAASIAIALVLGVPSTSTTLLAREGGRGGGADAAPFASTMERGGGIEPVLVALLQDGTIAAEGAASTSWPGLRAVPISADSSTSELLPTSELLSIIEARDMHVEDLADDVARMRRDSNDRS